MRNAVSALGIFAGTAVLTLLLGELDELTDEQVQAAVIVVIEPHGAGGPAGCS